jgi:MFS family permease
VTAFIQLLFPPQARGRAFAIMGAVIGVSSALGPIVGGLIIQAAGEESGWRLVFFVNLPVGLATVIAAILLLPSRRVAEEVAGDVRAQSGQRGSAAPAKATAPAATGVDIVGIVLVSAGLVALLVPLIDGQDQGWPLWTYLSLAGGVVLLALFGAWEVLQTRRAKSVLVPPHLFSHPAFTGGVILAMVYFAAFTSIFFTISILWQSGLGNSALASGLVSIPFAIGSIVGSSQSNRLTNRLGRSVLVIGTALVSVGLIWLWLVLLTTAAGDLTNWMLAVPLLLAGIGNGLFIAPNAQFIVATVDPAEAGAASGVIGTVQRVGSAVGIAVIGSVLFAGVAGAGIRGPQMVPQAFTDASASAMGVSAIFAVVAFALVFTLPRRVSRGH